jgi:hypothetical protein
MSSRRCWKLREKWSMEAGIGKITFSSEKPTFRQKSRLCGARSRLFSKKEPLQHPYFILEFGPVQTHPCFFNPYGAMNFMALLEIRILIASSCKNHFTLMVSEYRGNSFQKKEKCIKDFFHQ